MPKELREIDGELVFGEINPVPRREGVDIEQFERMSGMPLKTHRLQRAIPESSGQNDTDKIDEEKAEELYLSASIGREALESYLDEGYFNRISQEPEFYNPLWHLKEELEGQTEDQRTIDWLENRYDGKNIEKYGWFDTDEFLMDLGNVAQLIDELSNVDQEERHAFGETAASDEYTMIAGNIEEVMYEFQSIWD